MLQESIVIACLNAQLLLNTSNIQATGKYNHIDFKPPEGVQEAARRGLELRKKFGRGGLSNKEASEHGIGSGVQRAVNLANGSAVSPETIKRMVSFFARHAGNKDAKGSESTGFWGNANNPSAGYIAYLLWGGAPGESWCKKVAGQIDAADKK